MLLFELTNSIEDLSQAHGIGIPHGAAARGREAIAVNVNDVDVTGAKSDALLQDARPLIDEGVDRTLYDLLR